MGAGIRPSTNKRQNNVHQSHAENQYFCHWSVFLNCQRWGKANNLDGCRGVFQSHNPEVRIQKVHMLRITNKELVHVRRKVRSLLLVKRVRSTVTLIDPFLAPATSRLFLGRLRRIWIVWSAVVHGEKLVEVAVDRSPKFSAHGPVLT